MKKAKEGGNIDDIKKNLEEVNTVAQKIGASMYQQPGQDGQASATGNSADGTEKKDNKEEKSSDDEVVEGEVEEENKDNK